MSIHRLIEASAYQTTNKAVTCQSYFDTDTTAAQNLLFQLAMIKCDMNKTHMYKSRVYIQNTTLLPLPSPNSPITIL